MASSQLYKEARKQFVREAEARYKDNKDLELLRDFLTQNSSPEEAQAAAGALKTKTSEKWGAKRVGDTEIPAAWIDTLMANIGNFVAVGNYAMTGAPESVGLAWFAVKLTLSAIQSNYDLYTFFGSSLTDISEIMIIIPHYDRLYDERAKAVSHAEWKSSPVVDKLFQDIIDAYAAVLDFSLSIRRHLSAGTLAKLRHGFKDFFGVSKGKFEGKMGAIAALKQKILEDSQAIFQDKTLHQLDAVKGIVTSIEGTVTQIKDFQSELNKMHQEQTAQWQLLLEKMEDVKATTKPKTPWDLALQEFEKNKGALDPEKNTSDALGKAIDERHPGTCQWIFEGPEYKEWKNSGIGGLLCLGGQEDTGKSVVLATVVEQLDSNEDSKVALLYLNYGKARAGALNKGTASVDAVCNTLLYQLYSFARLDEQNVKLLEDCNRVFANPKASKGIGASGDKGDNLPEFSHAFSKIAERLDVDVVIALDGIEGLSQDDQRTLASRLRAVLAPSKASSIDSRAVKAVVASRSTSKFHKQVLANKVSLYCLDVGDFNDNDMAKRLTHDLDHIPGLTQAERQEAIDTILKKAGPRFAYINNIAIPFMREPFQRPLSRRLQSLPEGLHSIYMDALRKMSSNYIDLLQVALTWTLLAPVPPRVEEIMDAYNGTYHNRGPEVEDQARALKDVTFGGPSDLELEQLRDASGPFLRIDQEPQTGEYLVNLQDRLRVEEFFLHIEDTETEASSQEASFCSRCKSTLASSKMLSISPKEGHLKLALDCVRSLNSPIFQRRATAKEKIPEWSKPLEVEDSESVQDSESSEKSTVAGMKTEVGEPTNVNDGGIDQDSDQKSADENLETEQVMDENSQVVNAEDDGYNSEDSMDDEDKDGLFYNSRLDEYSIEDLLKSDSNSRTKRYELEYWTYHLREAEELWTPEEQHSNSTWVEMMHELDYFAHENQPFFNWWQCLHRRLSYWYGTYFDLHVAAYFGLTSWVTYLLPHFDDDANFRIYFSNETPLQVAALSASSIPMLKLLLERGADPNIEDENSPPAFQRWLRYNPSMESVQLFLKHGADPTRVAQYHQKTVLHDFVWRGTDPAALDLLLDHTVDGRKLDINAADDIENTALHMLLWRRQVPKALLQAFVDRGADVNAENISSMRPLQMASIFGDLEALQILCHGQSISEIDDGDLGGDSALLQAATGNHGNCIKFLLEVGADINLQNGRGLTSLHISAMQGAEDCAQILLAQGAQPNLFDRHNRTPFFFACNSESFETASILIDTLLERKVPMDRINALTKAHCSPLRQAASHGFHNVVRKLIETARQTDDTESLHINEQDNRKGMTPLHRAAMFGKVGCVQLLLDADADIAVRDNNDKTAMMLAYEHWTLTGRRADFEDIIALLIKRDASTAAADPELIATCAANGSTRLLQQLSEIGANLNCMDRYGWTPLELARKSQHADVVSFLKQQAAWAKTLPSRWAENSRTYIAEGGRDLWHTSGERICISTDKPLPAGLDKFYFEVTSKVLEGSGDIVPSEWPKLAIGFCTIGANAISFPGLPPRQDALGAQSWGYHGNDGRLYYSGNESGNCLDVDLPYRGGHTVGCGVDLTTHSMWLTRNGQKLESGFTNVQGRLFPLLGLDDEVQLETNFTGPFLWSSNEETT